MQAQMIQSEKMVAIGKLAAGVAHEINNPLTGVLTNSSLMLEDLPDDHPWREDLQTIVTETLRCRKIVKGLLDFARQTKPQRTLLDMNQVVEDVLALVRNQTTFRNVRVVNDLHPEPAVGARRRRPDAAGRAEHRAQRRRGDVAGRRAAGVVARRRAPPGGGGAHRGHRPRHPRRGAQPGVRAVLHDEEDRHRPRPRRRLRDHGTAPRRTAHRHGTRPGHDVHHPPADRRASDDD